MELRHQQKNDREVADEEKTRRDQELDQKQWPGKRSLTQQRAAPAEVDMRTPDLRRIRAALGALRSGGEALPGAMTAQYSQLLGLDLSDVRIHRGGAAGQAAKSLQATAFTAGTNIAVAEHLDLDSAFGRHVIAHELVHVAQNKRSGGGPMDLAAHAEIGPSGSAIEQEAERGALAINRGEAFSVQAHGRLPAISRYADDETPPPGAGSAPTTLPNRTPAPTRPDNTPTPTAQQTPAAPAPPPAPPAPAPTAAPTAQPRPTDQPANTPPAPATPGPGTPGYNQPSGSAPAPDPTVPGSTTPRPAATPRPQPAPTPAASLDARVQQILEERADPTLKAGYARAIAGVDALRIQALQYSFTPNGIWNTLVETFTARNAFQDHFGQIYSANAYRGGNSWADTAQAWIEGLRGVVHIIGDVASVISAWAGLVALVSGALALILSETVIGGIALGAIAAIAAEVALVAGAIKLLTDIIDLLLGIIQMIILVVRARNSKDPAQRARFAALLRKEANDFGQNVISIGVQVAVMAVSAGIGAGMSRGANSFMSAFKDEFSKMITPALKPWTLGNNFRNIARMATPVATGTGVRAGRTVLQAEVDQGLVGINRQARVGSRITRTREVIPFTTRNQMNGARLVTMRNAVGRAVVVNAGGVVVGLGGGQLQADIKQPRNFDRGGTASSSPSGGGGRLDAPARPAGADLSKVSMWPSQIEAFQNAKGPIQGAVDRTQRQYEMAEAQAGPELAAQVRQAFQGANNQAGQMRFGAMQVQTDAREGQANTQRGLQQTGQARNEQGRMGATQDNASRSVQRIQGEGGKLQSPPPKEGVLGWLYNQTIGRIGAWIGSAQRWVTNLVGKWAMSLAGFSKEEMDIAGIENDMREDDKKDQTSTQEAQDAATRADQIQQTVFTLQENKTRDEQYAIQAMADSQRFIQALEDADRQLAAAITNGQSYIQTVTPIIAHELQTEQAQAAIDAQYIAPLVAYGQAFTESIDASNIGAQARTDGNGALAQMKAAYPELDIAPGTTAIGNAGAQYDTAFATLAGQARGQVAAMQTAVQAFVGTQDYDGVSANAAALDALAADFDRSAQALADQLYAAINNTITTYNQHIQRAIDAANAVPADQPDPAAAPPPPPADEGPPADEHAAGFGRGYARERQGVTATPAAQSEVKAPIADNAAKPATSDAAMAEKKAEPPPANQQAAPEKAPDASAGQEPAANDGSPAKDDVKAGSGVDKPKGETAGKPATAKPFGTPKDNATKSEADKTDADKLDLGGPMPAPDGGSDSEAKPSASSSAKPKADRSKPQATPVAEPVTTSLDAAVGTTTTDAKAKQKPERKAPKKTTKDGGGASSSAGGSDAEVPKAESESEEETEEAIDAAGTDADTSTTVEAGSESTEEEDGEGEATGEGQAGTGAPPAQAASGGTTGAEVTHTTEATATGAADDRTTVGVGEKVTFESTEAGNWSASAVGPGGRATKSNSHNFEWVAPATASSVSVTVTPTGGTAKTIDMTVIAPSTIDFESPQEQSYPAGTQGAGMITNVRYKPTTVSFYRTQWKEIGGPASGATGYFTNVRLPAHRPNPNWLQIGDDNGGPTDHASFYGFPSPWSAGSFQWVIPNRYLVNGESGAGHEFAQITQSCVMQSDGTTTITKGSASVTRSPGGGSQRGSGGGAGYGVGGGKSGGSTPRAKARARLSGIVARLARGPVGWSEIDGAQSQAEAAYAEAKPAGLWPYLWSIRCLGMARNDKRDWRAMLRDFDAALPKASDFISAAEKRALLAARKQIETDKSIESSPMANRPAPATPKKKPLSNPMLDAIINPNNVSLTTASGLPTIDKSKPLQRNTPTPKKAAKPAKPKVETPKLDQAIDVLEVVIPALPESVRPPLESAKASLELARTSAQGGEPANYVKHIGALGEAVIKSIAEVAKLFGRNAELAGQAASQLSKFAGVLGGVAKIAGALEASSRAFRGKTLSGTPVDINARWEAWLDLVGAIPVIGTAVTITKTVFMNIVNGIGVPAKDALTTRGLKNLFPGTTPDALKAQIQAMPTDPAVAYGTIQKLWDGTFKPTTGFSANFNLADAWRKYLLASLRGYENEFKDIQQRGARADDFVKERMAQHYKDAAIRFIDKQVREATSWDGTLIKR